MIVNGAECEPYLTADHRIMLEYPGEVVRGPKAAASAGCRSAWIGIENNKPDAIAAIEKAASGSDIRVAPLKVKYPQGAEKQLIYAYRARSALGRPADGRGRGGDQRGHAYQICQAIGYAAV